MTLYAGQTELDVVPLANEVGKTLFDEATRKQAYSAFKNGQVGEELHNKLVAMYQDGSVQAQYFLGEFITEGLIEYPISDNEA